MSLAQSLDSDALKSDALDTEALDTEALDLKGAPFRSDLESWGATLCVAPHPDDESLGCGGTLSLLAEKGLRVGVAWVSDGGLSHPNSAAFPRRRLAQLRQQEALDALQQLGLAPEAAYFQGLPDGALPLPGEPGFDEAVASARAVLERFRPQTLLLPWRRDPHRDHRAAWAIWTRATRDWKLQRLEYLVWAFERAAPREWPSRQEATAFRIDISAVLARKMAAIAAHRSQTTDLIDDDPSAFRLSPAVLAHFQKPYESWVLAKQHLETETDFSRPHFETERFLEAV